MKNYVQVPRTRRSMSLGNSDLCGGCQDKDKKIDVQVARTKDLCTGCKDKKTYLARKE